MESQRTIPVFYANIAEIQLGPFDARIRFGVKKDRANSERNDNDWDCEVYMSPQHLKACAGLFQSTLQAYQREFEKLEITVESEETKQSQAERKLS